jgi:tRNA(adenine34) deaminase
MLSSAADHERWMRVALEQAALAGAAGEVPVGAVVVVEDEVIGAGCNACIGSHDPTAHAEIVALRQAACNVANYRLPGATLYVTVEPCTMCAGAAVHARLGEVVYGATEPKSGAVISTSTVLDNTALNHRVNVVGGVLAEESAQILRAFFAKRRRAARGTTYVEDGPVDE